MFGFGLSYESALILFPEYHAKMCLNPDALNPALLQWSWYTSTFVIIVLIFAPLRLSAYAGLGKNFTFALAKPNKLITTGIYRYVQHPSYTGLVLLLGVWYWTLMRLDGAAACLLPFRIVHIKALSLVSSFLMSSVTLAGLWVRVKDEETMMEKEFGKEWVEYHSKTKRFIPGVF
jgi:protein-S-isoprenylcysteine O-methyltransferase Ste14